jgi:predicted Zn-dependent peptidase
MKTGFTKKILPNGLTVLVHPDPDTRMGSLNIMVKVGSRDEDPEHTGFAHLFEHLMFSGSQHIPSYDQVAQSMGAENNAFTSNDLTDYYLTFPAHQLEVALWLERDRMSHPVIDQNALDTQKSVVIEEFKQRYLNQPYGDAWLELRNLAYTVHPYRWATIGKELAHIEKATLEVVLDFKNRFYAPDRMILAVSGPYESEHVVETVQRWFGDWAPSGYQAGPRPQEPVQNGIRRLDKHGSFPAPALYMAFHMPGRGDAAYQACDLITDVLSRGQSSRLFRDLVMDRGLFSDLNAYVTGDMDPGLLVVSGHCAPGVEVDRAENAVWESLERLRHEEITDFERDKSLHQIESSLVFARLQGLNMAMNLCYFEYLSRAEDYDLELDRYRAVTPTMIREQAFTILQPSNASVLRYIPSDHES